MIQSQVVRPAAFRHAAQSRLGRRPRFLMPPGVWARLADDRRAVHLKIVLLIATAAVAALLEVPWR